MMSLPSVRIATAAICVAALLLISCSTPPAKTAGTPAFYWAAAAQTYAAGDYMKTLGDLDQLVATSNAYTSQAIAWRLVLTSGIVRGYMDLADRYAFGARINKAGALALRLQASKYRKVAAGFALRFAEQTDGFNQVPLGYVPLAFAFPKGNAGEPPLFSRIGSGIEITPAEQESAETLAVQRGVLMAVCLAVGAPNDIAKAREILGRGAAHTTRAAFGDALAQTLKVQATLFAREKLDEPQKAMIFEERAESVRVEGARVGSARIGLVVSPESTQ